MFKRMNEIYPDWLDNPTGETQIITAIAALAQEYDNTQEEESKKFTWLYNSIELLTLEYMGNNSGMKYISPLLWQYFVWNGEGMTALKNEKIAKIIFNRYKDKWIKLSGLYNFEYNPIENYSSVEERTPFDKETTTTTNKVNIIVSDNNSGDNSVYGFNSVDPVKQNENNQNNTQTTIANPEDNKTINELTKEGKEILTRKGNIGVTTSQQMLQSEIDLWKAWDFVKEFFKDLDNVLCLSIY